MYCLFAYCVVLHILVACLLTYATILQEAMETKTDLLEDVELQRDLTTKVSDIQLDIQKKFGWEPIDKLTR